MKECKLTYNGAVFRHPGMTGDSLFVVTSFTALTVPVQLALFQIVTKSFLP
ncbi:hypothetical protein V4V36_16190 [Paenibacillus lautus]|uniref:hypothetical protein n=1 Tax=Paenibacillus lautus TaxID=1401 RepID=UPI0013C4A035|nr:hypothetical protein [Paenibacillus lautus]